MRTTRFRRRGWVMAALVTLLVTPAAHAHEDDHTGRIVGGKDVNIVDHPWVVALAHSGYPYCGGILVRPTKVVTAAHCVRDARLPSLQVISGRTDLLDDKTGTVSTVKERWVHPGFTSVINGDDVAVLTLDAALAGPPLPVVVDDRPYRPGTMAAVLGWGRTSEDGPTSPRQLRMATLPVIEDESCAKSYKEFKRERMVCAGYPQGGVDTCQGDSGGPLIVGIVLVGVTSWGEGCARPGKPGVYTRLLAYRDLIAKQLQPGHAG
ncbi:serine protease [Longimycelium tulufanense]|uniref:Serine protease n=1 Tax=Longimycelium tulufanense TaxID=907463 RepID=A0A8J3FUW4_9PSEU|nr:serine protease [Longimycelium tulufanense]GGM38978.1 serine protease [Longimycelium tulufanense]